MPRPRFLFFVVNPRAGVGRGRLVRSRVEETVRQLGDEAEMRVLHHGEDIGAAVEQGIYQGATDIIAVGGDGTVGGVAGALAGTDLAMGVVPAGTANMLARELGLPLSTGAALRVILGHHAHRRIDVMEMGGRRFVYQIVIGPSSEALSRLTSSEKRLMGRMSYALFGLRMFGDFRPLEVKGTVDGKEFRGRVSQVTIANAGILGVQPFRLGQDIRIDDGRVEVILLRGRSRVSYIAAGLDLLTGNYLSSSTLRYLHARDSIHLEAVPETVIRADGDSFGRTPLDVKVLPNAVKIIVPPWSP